MFCPEGYRSVAELWDMYREKRLRAFYESATFYYKNEDLSHGGTRGSPLDICEHSFLRSISICGLHLASPEGKVMLWHAPLDDGTQTLFSVLTVHKSAYLWTAYAQEAERNGETVATSKLFKPWHVGNIDPRHWSSAYPQPKEIDAERLVDAIVYLKHHTLPICFERTTYTVVRSIPPWASRIKIEKHNQSLIEHFGGWAVCVSEDALETWWPYLNGKSVYPDERDNFKPGKTGRPWKQENAKRDFNLTFPNGLNVGWSVVPERIKEKTGNMYSESTIRRAITNDPDS